MGLISESFWDKRPFILYDNFILNPENLEDCKKNKKALGIEFFNEVDYFESGFYKTNLFFLSLPKPNYKFIVSLLNINFIGKPDDIQKFLKNLPIVELHQKGIRFITVNSCNIINFIDLSGLAFYLDIPITEQLIGYFKVKEISYVPQESIRVLVQLIGVLEKTELGY